MKKIYQIKCSEEEYSMLVETLEAYRIYTSKVKKTYEYKPKKQIIYRACDYFEKEE